MAAARRLAAASCCQALRRALHGRLRAVVEVQLRACHRYLAGASSSSTSSAPAAGAALSALLLLCTEFPGAVAFFLPLVASTSLCCAAACLFAADERGAAAKEAAVEVVMLAGGREGGKPEVGLLQVIGEANASAYGGGDQQVQVGCFLRRSAKRGLDEDGEVVVFAGTLAARVGVAGGGGHGQRRGAMEEELAAVRVDRLAGGVWDSYFGGWSRWHDVDVDVDGAVSCS